MDKRETIAIEAVKLAISLTGEGFDPDSEGSMAMLELRARAIANVMMALANPLGDLKNPLGPETIPAGPGIVHVETAPPQPEAVQAPPTTMDEPPIIPNVPATLMGAPPQEPAEPFPQPVQPPQQFQPPQAAPSTNAPPVATGVMHPGSTDDEMWASIVGELQAENGGHTTSWWDNRSSKKSAKASDFAHKSIQAPSKKTGQMWPIAVWVRSAPDWASAIINQYAAPPPNQ